MTLVTKVDLYEKLHEFTRLGENWDSYGGHPLTEKAAEVAMTIIEAMAEHMHADFPGLVPIVSGGVELYWGGEEITVDVHPDGSASIWCEGVVEP